MKKGVWIGCGLAALAGVVLCGGFIALIGGGVWTIVAATQPVADGATDFLSLVGQDKSAEAYASAGSVLRAQSDEASFTAAVKQLGLTDFVSASWNSRRMNNQSGTVEGTIVTKSGSSPAKLDLTFEQGKWRVVDLHYAGRDLGDLMSAQLPPDEDLRRMAVEGVKDLDEAVQAKNFTALHAKISDKWRQEVTVPQLQNAFQVFIDKGLVLAPAKDSTPQFDPAPAVDAKGVLTLEGTYQTDIGLKVHFKFHYIHEAAGWKLSGVHLST